MLYPRRIVLWTVVGLLFVLSTTWSCSSTTHGADHLRADRYALDARLLDALVALRRTGRTLRAAATGLVTGSLVLTRATWYLFPIPCLSWSRRSPRRGGRAVPRRAGADRGPPGRLGAQELRGLRLSALPATSAWGGLHALAGLRSAGLLGEFEAFRNANGLVPTGAARGPDPLFKRSNAGSDSTTPWRRGPTRPTRRARGPDRGPRAGRRRPPGRRRAGGSRFPGAAGALVADDAQHDASLRLRASSSSSVSRPRCCPPSRCAVSRTPPATSALVLSSSSGVVPSPRSAR